MEPCCTAGILRPSKAGYSKEYCRNGRGAAGARDRSGRACKRYQRPAALRKRPVLITAIRPAMPIGTGIDPAAPSRSHSASPRGIALHSAENAAYDGNIATGQSWRTKAVIGAKNVANGDQPPDARRNGLVPAKEAGRRPKYCKTQACGTPRRPAASQRIPLQWQAWQCGRNSDGFARSVSFMALEQTACGKRHVGRGINAEAAWPQQDGVFYTVRWHGATKRCASGARHGTAPGRMRVHEAPGALVLHNVIYASVYIGSI